MKLCIVAGPPSSGKTTLISRMIEELGKDMEISFLKIDVTVAHEDEEIHKRYNIPTKKVITNELCPDHAGVLILGSAIEWAKDLKSDLLIVESAGLCLRCSPYLNQGVGIAVISSIFGMQTPEKMGSMLSQADIVTITRIDLVSQAEREVFAQKIREFHSSVSIIETNALQGTALERLYKYIRNSKNITNNGLLLKGSPPLGTCTICVGKKEIGWENHFGIIRKLDGADYLFRGE